MSILNQNLLTLDFWQDKVTYGKKTVPIGTIGCAALNITDEQIAALTTLCQPLNEIILMLGTQWPTCYKKSRQGAVYQ